MSRGHLAMAQRSEVGREEWAAEQARDLHGRREAEETLRGGGEGDVVLPSQRMHSKGEQGNQTRSEPVSM